MQCDGAKKATVTFDDKGKITKVVSKNPGVEVTIKRLVGVKITVTGDVERANSHNPGVSVDYIDPDGVMNDNYTLAFKVCTTDIGCGASSPNDKGEKYYQAQLYKNGKYTGYHFGTAGWYSVGISGKVAVNPQEGATGKYRATVIDRTGEIFKKDFDDPPKYWINCDDECPEGQMKCSCNRPPGYCCIPCSDFRSGLIAIKAKLK